MEPKKNKGGRPVGKDLYKYHYNFKLNEELNSRFCAMLKEADCGDNKTKFILSRIFGWELKVVKTDRATLEFCTRLNDFYYQFRKVGTNYNQVVKAIHHNYDTESASRMLWTLEQYTRRMVTLQEQIMNLCEQFRRQWLQE